MIGFGSVLAAVTYGALSFITEMGLQAIGAEPFHSLSWNVKNGAISGALVMVGFLIFVPKIRPWNSPPE